MRFSFCILIFLVLFTFPVFAQEPIFTEFNAHYSLESSQVQVTYGLKYDQVSDLNFSIPSDAQSVKVLSSNSEINFQILDLGKERLLFIPSLSSPGTLTISYFSQELLQSSSKNFFLSESRTSLPVKTLNVQVKLTEGQALLNPISSSDQPVFPFPDSIEIQVHYKKTVSIATEVPDLQ